MQLLLAWPQSNAHPQCDTPEGTTVTVIHDTVTKSETIRRTNGRCGRMSSWTALLSRFFLRDTRTKQSGSYFIMISWRINEWNDASWANDSLGRSIIMNYLWSVFHIMLTISIVTSFLLHMLLTVTSIFSCFGSRALRSSGTSVLFSRAVVPEDRSARRTKWPDPPNFPTYQRTHSLLS